VPYVATELLENTMAPLHATAAKDSSEGVLGKSMHIAVGSQETALLIRIKGISAVTADCENASKQE